MPQPEFVDALAALGGIPEPVLAHQELMDVLLPALRADFRLAEEPVPGDPGAPLHCPITAFGGLHDPLTTDESLSAWSFCTVSTFRRLIFTGDHFFHVTRQDEVVAQVVRVISEVRPG